MQLRKAQVLSRGVLVTGPHDIRQPITVEVTYEQHQPYERPTVSVHFVNEQGITLLCSCDFTNRDWWERTDRSSGVYPGSVSRPWELLGGGTDLGLQSRCAAMTR